MKVTLQTSFLIWALLQAAVVQSASLIEPFLGTYKGHAIFEEGGVSKERDLSVSITESDEGFTINWQSTSFKADGKTKTKEYEIKFVPTDRPQVFQAAQKPNLFGGLQPLDPMKGEPYVWTRIVDKTLTVHALLVNDDGGYELQIYDRTLVEGGVDLSYQRIRNGEMLKTISAMLTRE